MAGPASAVRRGVLGSLVAWNSTRRVSAYPPSIRRQAFLENQQDNLVAFAVDLDHELAALAQEWQMIVIHEQEMLKVQSLPMWDPKRCRREAALQRPKIALSRSVC